MTKTVVEFALPFAAIDEGKYEIKLGIYTSTIIIKHIPNPCGLRELLKMGIEEGTLKLEFDGYGIANFSQITLELPYQREEHDEKKIHNTDPPSYSLKKDCILFLNRLIDVVRFETRLHWIPYIHEKMIHRVSKKVYDDEGKEIEDVMALDFGGGLQFNRGTRTQIEAKETISEKLKTDIVISIHERLFLDAIRYFEEGRNNESVILTNIALEEFVTNQLYNKAIKKFGESKVEEILDKIKGTKKFGKVLTTHLKNIDNRSLEDNKELWNKYNFIRNIRKQAVHPNIRQISVDDAFNVLDYTDQIGRWISS